MDWNEKCATLTVELQAEHDAAQVAHKRPSKKPNLPLKPKRPMNSRLEDLGVEELRDLLQAAEIPVDGGVPYSNKDKDDNDGDINMLQDSELDCFTEVAENA